MDRESNECQRITGIGSNGNDLNLCEQALYQLFTEQDDSITKGREEIKYGNYVKNDK